MPKLFKTFFALSALAALGTAVNFFKIPVLFGVEFPFGSVFALVAAAVYGPFAGMAIASAITFATLGIQSHPFMMIIGAVEALVVGLVTRKLKNNLLLASAIFWLLLGPILVWCFYRLVMELSVQATVMVWLKQSVNGIFNALLANLVLLGLGIHQRKDTNRPPLTFHQVFFTTLVSLVLIPALTLMIATSRSKMSSIEQEATSKTQALAQSVDLVLTGWRKARVEAVAELSYAATDRNVLASSELQRDIRHIAVSAAGFSGMVVTDLEGKVTASFVTNAPPNTSILGTSYGDRPFIKELQSGSDLVISDVFMSRGITAIPIVVFANPILFNGKKVGFAAGAADLTTLKNTIARYSSNTGVTISILDGSGTVVASTIENLNPLDKHVVAPGDIEILGNGSYHRLPTQKKLVPSMTRWEQSVYGSRISASNLPWSIVAEASLQPYSRDLQHAYTEIFGLMLALCYGGLAISYLLTRWIGGPILNLADMTSGIVSKVQDGDKFSWPWSPLKELSALIENFKSMAEALQSRFHELQSEIQERTLTQDKLVSATAAAQAANQAKSEFLANMSHEIRTPLGAVLGFTELLGSKDLKPSERQEYLQAIERNGEQLYRLIDDVLDFSKIEVGHIKLEPQETSLDDIVSGCIKNLTRQAQDKGLKLNVNGTTLFPATFIVDPTRLKQILLNIVGNAVKFTTQGHVDVLFTLELKADTPKGLLKIVVSDSGVGFSESEASEKLFKVFGQIDSSRSRRYGGTGLGLVLSRRLAQAMGGNVELLDASPEGGCTFEVTVSVGIAKDAVMYKSLREACLAAVRQPTTRERPKTLTGLTVLVVEDAPDNRLLFHRVLTSLGAAVEMAESGVEGLELATHKTYDIILMDIQMPGLDGLETTALLRRQGYLGPIAALTAHALQEDRRRCLEGGFDEYLSKPVDWQRLTEVILRLVHSRTGPTNPILPSNLTRLELI